MERKTFKEMLKDVLPELLKEHLNVEIYYDSFDTTIDIKLFWDDDRITFDETYIESK